ncbi:polysaccharide deacetylase family protein [Paenibacillus pinihumi]|uniref:polysaccharide deacetylase family protein n=1 Tax=Paenibacillus pinihumi TaxID=669462 RepID=UPI00040A71E2|nr:polysaccharide deacetylase family protein [Paenibacillus pinihumi]
MKPKQAVISMLSAVIVAGIWGMPAAAHINGMEEILQNTKVSESESTFYMDDTVNNNGLYKMDSNYRFVPVNDTASARKVLLTFDDGPKDRAVLEKLLGVLEKHSAKAIFFVNGIHVEKHPELLRLIDRSGQTVGNHTWSHPDLRKLPPEEAAREIQYVQDIVSKIIGKKPRFFRPPYGSGNEQVRRIAKNHALLYMTWSNGSLDWAESARNNPAAVIRNVMSQLHPGANILMHEVPWTADALDSLLSNLEAQGYGFIDPAAIIVPAGSAK